jgi:hypothetical protein
MSLRCRQRFSGKERCLLDHLSPFRTSCSPLFSPSIGYLPGAHWEGKEVEGTHIHPMDGLMAPDTVNFTSTRK